MGLRTVRATSAKAEGDEWYAGACLAGEAGLRVGEVKALRWREDVDMIARTITVNQQTCNGDTTTPKGRTLLDENAPLGGSDLDVEVE